MAETQLQVSEVMVQKHSLHVQNLYNQYAAMLLGYIFEVVKNMTVAEQYLIAVFKDVPHEIDEISKSDVNSFCHLQLMARKKLTTFFDSVDECTLPDKKPNKTVNTSNKFVALMNTHQQLVFCGVYWHGKSISTLATELNKTEDAIRKILKECFTTIRNNSK